MKVKKKQENAFLTKQKLKPDYCEKPINIDALKYNVAKVGYEYFNKYCNLIIYNKKY